MAGLVDPLLPAEVAKAQAEQSPSRAWPIARIRELSAILLLVLLADVTLYRGAGFAGVALFFVGTPLLLLLGSASAKLRGSTWVVSAMLLLLAARLLWQGNVAAVVLGLGLVVAFSLALHGLRPYLIDIVAGIAQLAIAGGFGLADYRRASRRRTPPRTEFVLAQLAAAVRRGDPVWDVLCPGQSRCHHLGADHWPAALRAPARVGGGAVAELAGDRLLAGIGVRRPGPVAAAPAPRSFPIRPALASPYAELDEPAYESPLYRALRNTLWAVIGLFAIYLVFEFQTLWFRKFPPGFYYAGYAHEGAGWLTAALALATLVLSLIFRGQVLRDPRLAKLRLLAWIWSAENLLLALTVYNRMYIYIDFNGMTRMRTIGLFGITAVVVGFVLVLWKIVHNRDFVWLIHRQLWALAVAIYLLLLMPVDALVHSYNVRQILAGDLAPAVQISVHPISAEGYLVLMPLLHCQDPIIRDGIRAMLAEQEIRGEQRAKEREPLGWTTLQLSDERLRATLTAHRREWQELHAQSAAPSRPGAVSQVRLSMVLAAAGRQPQAAWP